MKCSYRKNSWYTCGCIESENEKQFEQLSAVRYGLENIGYKYLQSNGNGLYWEHYFRLADRKEYEQFKADYKALKQQYKYMIER